MIKRALDSRIASVVILVLVYTRSTRRQCLHKGDILERFFIGICVAMVLIGCGSTVPKQSATLGDEINIDPPSGPADIAVLPFENKTGNPKLNWLRTAFSATMSVRIRVKQGLVTTDGSFVRSIMDEQDLKPSGVLNQETVIGLSGLLYAESIVTGAFEGEEKSLILTASMISGETGEVIKSATTLIANNHRSRAVNHLIDVLYGVAISETYMNRDGNLPAETRTRFRNRVRIPGRMNIEMPAPLELNTPADIENAIRVYRQTVEANPDFSDAYFSLGYAYDKQGDIDNALTAYRQAVTLNPLNADYLYTLGYVYERRKVYRDAVDAYATALALTPDDADIAFALGYAHEQMGEYSEAIKAYQHAIKVNPEDHDAHHGLAAAYETSGRLKEALDQYQQVMKDQSDNEILMETYGAIAYKLQNWPEVVFAYEKLSQVEPDEVSFHRILARAYRQNGKWDKAIGSYHQVIKLLPSSTAAYTSLGYIFVKTKKYNKAVEQYRLALKTAPSSSTLYYNLGNVLMAQKDYRGAMDAYVGYIEHAPNGKYEAKIRTKIEDLRFKIMMQE